MTEGADLVVTNWIDDIIGTHRRETVSGESLRGILRDFNALTTKEKETAFLYLLGQIVRLDDKN